MRVIEIFKLKDGVGRTGSGLIPALLSLRHQGIVAGNQVLIDILPETKKRSELKKFLQDYHSFLFYRQHPSYSDAKLIHEIHFHVDRSGKPEYFAVPSGWMEKIEEIKEKRGGDTK